MTLQTYSQLQEDRFAIGFSKLLQEDNIVHMYIHTLNEYTYMYAYK